MLLAATNAPDEIPPLRPPRAEILPGFWEQYALLVVVAAILLLILLGALGWFLTRPRPPLVPAPAEQARSALESLHRQPEDGAVLSRVSQVLRRYLQAAFGLPPEELTTAELCQALNRLDGVGPELSARLGEFLRRCDARKFDPAPQPALGAAQQALQLIAASEQRLAQAPPAVPAAPTATGKAEAQNLNERQP